MTLLDYTSPAFTEELFRTHGSFVAVVMNFNKSGLVARAVESAFSQNHPCYEILALDDFSTDGSDAELLASVKNCIASNPEKPLKVRVVRNERNLGILGQWRQAAAISSGEWFGMFAGDDTAEPNRIEAAAQIISSYPDAAAICTNYIEEGASQFAWPDSGVLVKRPGDLAWHEPATILGCTAFYRRRLLELPLPDGIMDDFTLTWLAVISASGSLVWATDRSTVSYSLGTGVTTSDQAKPLSPYAKYKAIVARGKRFGRNVWDKIKRFDDQYGQDPAVSRQVRGCWVASWTEGGNWFVRLGALWTMLVTDRGNDYGGMRRELVRKVLRRVISRFLGPITFLPIYLTTLRKKPTTL